MLLKSNDIFQNTSLKLTGLYLIVIMTISLVFSVGLYNVSSQEIERGIKRTFLPERQRALLYYPELNQLIAEAQQKDLDDALRRLKADLALINLLIFIFGGLLSYILARKSLEPIEKAHNSQSRFTADASHELRTPITAMRLETELALSDPKLTLPLAKKQLESNIEELDKLTSLSESMLQLSRLENGELDKEQISVEHLINLAIDRVKAKTEDKKQQIDVENSVKKDLEVNTQYITDALSTLLDNAVKYSPDKSIIKISAKNLSGKIQIEIKDQGIGINASEIPHIFERFYRADQSRTKSHEHGYGIGLSIAKAAVEAHEGTITVKSAPNKGSTFTITLPV